MSLGLETSSGRCLWDGTKAETKKSYVSQDNLTLSQPNTHLVSSSHNDGSSVGVAIQSRGQIMN